MPDTRIPWFMHMVDGPDGRHNSLTGVYATPTGVYVRTWTTKPRGGESSLEVTFYPLETERREASRIYYKRDAAGEVMEQEATEAVRNHQADLAAK